MACRISPLVLWFHIRARLDSLMKSKLHRKRTLKLIPWWYSNETDLQMLYLWVSESDLKALRGLCIYKQFLKTAPCNQSGWHFTVHSYLLLPDDISGLFGRAFSLGTPKWCGQDRAQWGAATTCFLSFFLVCWLVLSWWGRGGASFLIADIFAVIEASLKTFVMCRRVMK